MDERALGSTAEQSLALRLRAGDETALGELYDQHGRFVYGLAHRVIGDRQAAEDVTQDVFVSMWEQADRFDPERGSLRAFLGTLAHRRSVDLIRREEARRRREDRTSLDAVTTFEMQDGLEIEYTTSRIRDAMAALPDPQRLALELAYFKGHTYRQVALVLGIPEGTAKSRLRLGLQRLAEILQPEMDQQWA
jgi:RNA polymerase sigma-70 factor (ECF subfamily)